MCKSYNKKNFNLEENMIKQQVKSILKKFHLEKIGQEHLIADINRDCTRTQKKILLCYLDYERTVRELNRHFGHTNRQEMMQIVKVCIELDLRIDICACYDTGAFEQIREHYYDYIFGFGETFFHAKEKNPEAKAIFYTTENPYYVSFERETERLRYLKERTGRSFHLERTGVYYKKDDEKKADCIVSLGDTEYLKHLNVPVQRVWPSALKNPTFQLDFSEKKKENFLVYGVDGFVHKGNDILIEIFQNHPEWQLYLCGARGAEKAKEAGYDLPANVHACGFVDTESETFNKLAAKCYYLLLPSCSEGVPTSVLTGLRHGILPIVTKGNGLDELPQFCRYFEDYHIASVEATIQRAVEESEERLMEQGRAAMEYADAHFTLEAFTGQMRTVLEKMFQSPVTNS